MINNRSFAILSRITKHAILPPLFRTYTSDSSFHTKGFSRDANLYETSRPRYVTKSIDFLLKQSQIHPIHASSKIDITEVGAGTGIFTECLTNFYTQNIHLLKQNTQLNIYAVEPISEMRKKLEEKKLSQTVHSDSVELKINVIPLNGTALNLPTQSPLMDVIFCAQSFHCFATKNTLKSFYDVIKQGGALGLVWNMKNAAVDWVKQLVELEEEYNTENTPRYHKYEWVQVFENQNLFKYVANADFKNSQIGDLDMIINRVLTTSFISKLDNKEEVRNRVKKLLIGHPDLKGKTEYELPYITNVFVYQKL